MLLIVLIQEADIDQVVILVGVCIVLDLVEVLHDFVGLIKILVLDVIQELSESRLLLVPDLFLQLHVISQGVKFAGRVTGDFSDDMWNLNTVLFLSGL